MHKYYTKNMQYLNKLYVYVPYLVWFWGTQVMFVER